MARHCCITLKHLAPLLIAAVRQQQRHKPRGAAAAGVLGAASAASAAAAAAAAAVAVLSRSYGQLCRVMLTRGLGEATWFSAAGMAQELCEA